jgi:hypothetical protein
MRDWIKFACIVAGGLIGAVALLYALMSWDARTTHIALREDGVLEWRGTFRRDDVEKFRRMHVDTDVKALFVRDSRGGDLAGLRAMQTFIREHDLPMRVEGGCVSACAMLFIASRHRALTGGSEWRPTYLHIHGAYRPGTNEFLNTFKDSELTALDENTRGRFPHELYVQARLVPNPKGGLYIFAAPYRDSHASVFLCKGDEPSIPLACSAMPELSVVSLGLIESPS